MGRAGAVRAIVRRHRHDGGLAVAERAERRQHRDARERGGAGRAVDVILDVGVVGGLAIRSGILDPKGLVVDQRRGDGDGRLGRNVVDDRDGEIVRRGIAVRVRRRETEVEIDAVLAAAVRMIDLTGQRERVRAAATVGERNAEHFASMRHMAGAVGRNARAVIGDAENEGRGHHHELDQAAVRFERIARIRSRRIEGDGRAIGDAGERDGAVMRRVGAVVVVVGTPRNPKIAGRAQRILRRRIVAVRKIVFVDRLAVGLTDDRDIVDHRDREIGCRGVAVGVRRDERETQVGGVFAVARLVIDVVAQRE